MKTTDHAHSFNEISKIITENGGKIADLDEPKLTHVVVDPRDRSRLKELVARTALCVLVPFNPNS